MLTSKMKSNCWQEAVQQSPQVSASSACGRNHMTILLQKILSRSDVCHLWQSWLSSRYTAFHLSLPHLAACRESDGDDKVDPRQKEPGSQVTTLDDSCPEELLD